MLLPVILLHRNARFELGQNQPWAAISHLRRVRCQHFEFVIPLAKYVKAIYHTRVSNGMRFQKLFETKESSVHWNMATITHISDLNAISRPNSH
ncbi:auxin response factor 25-like [Andrographis paniculata]|uniref:auxin response factor 25-like n=1 Tax=Andrographis paniculata TaxID=175694 RepID=UPI0021E8EC92|nr:auxin response factor 25-like [Andrographis paniculata]